jgi:hypothetical protein
LNDGRNPGLNERFKVDVVDPYRKIVNMGELQDVVVVSDLSHGKVLTVRRQWKDRVCVLYSTDESDINYLQRQADEAGALALLVVKRPTARADLPTFVLPEVKLAFAKSAPLLKARISISGGKIESRAVDPSPPSVTESQRGKAGSAPKSYAEAVTETEPMSAWGWGRDLVKSAVSVFAGKKHFFSAEEKDVQAYLKGLKSIEEVLNNRNAQDVDYMLADVKTYLKRKKCQMGHLAAAAYICNALPGQSDSLRIALYDRLRKVDASNSEELKLLKHKPKLTADQPRGVMCRFLLENSAEWSSHLALLNSRDEGVVSILSILCKCGLLEQKEFPSAEWKSLRLCVDDRIFDSKQAAFMAAVEPNSFDTLRLCFSSDFAAFVKQIKRLSDSSDKVRLNGFLYNIILLLVDEHMERDPCPKTFTEAWRTVLTLLERVDFAVKKGDTGI